MVETRQQSGGSVTVPPDPRLVSGGGGTSSSSRLVAAMVEDGDGGGKGAARALGGESGRARRGGRRRIAKVRCRTEAEKEDDHDSLDHHPKVENSSVWISIQHSVSCRHPTIKITLPNIYTCIYTHEQMKIYYKVNKKEFHELNYPIYPHSRGNR